MLAAALQGVVVKAQAGFAQMVQQLGRRRLLWVVQLAQLCLHRFGMALGIQGLIQHVCVRQQGLQNLAAPVLQADTLLLLIGQHQARATAFAYHGGKVVLTVLTVAAIRKEGAVLHGTEQ